MASGNQYADAKNEIRTVMPGRLRAELCEACALSINPEAIHLSHAAGKKRIG